MSFWKHANPANAISDFIAVYRQAGKNRYTIAVLSAAATVLIFSPILVQSWTKERTLPEITYINSWPADRTEEETRAFIARNQVEKEARLKAEAQAEAEAQKMWMAVGRASGMDVEAMKAKADAEKAAAAAAEKAKLEAAARDQAKAPLGR